MVDIHKAIAKKFHLSNKTRRNLPWCSGWRYTRNNLAELIGEQGLNRGAEIGVRTGTFSRKLCQANPNIELYCIDPWTAIETKYPQEKQDRIYARAVDVLSPYNAKLIKKTSMDALEDFEPESLDFVYIDGDHRFDYVMMDIICWSSKVRTGGIIGAHDVYNGEVGVVKAVEAYTHSHNIVPWYITKELQPTAYWVKP